MKTSLMCGAAFAVAVGLGANAMAQTGFNDPRATPKPGRYQGQGVTVTVTPRAQTQRNTQPSPEQQRAQIAAEDRAYQQAACLEYRGLAVLFLSYKNQGVIIERTTRIASDIPPKYLTEEQKLRLVGATYYGQDLYSKEPGGFPVYAYKTCMAGNLF